MFLAWLEAAALTGVFIALGAVIDTLTAGALPAVGVLAAAAAAGVAAAAAAGSALLTARTEHRAERSLRTDLIASIWRGGVTAATGRTDALLALASDAVPRAARYRGAFIGPTIGAFTTPLVVLALVAWFIDPLTAALLAAMVVVVPALIVLAQRASRRPGAAHRREQGRLAALFRQNVQGLGTLVTHRAAASAARELATQGERHRRSLMRVLATNQLVILVMDVTVNVGLLLVGALFALHRLEEGVLSPGGALAVVLATLLVIRPIGLVGQFFYIGIGGRAAERALSAQFASAPENPRVAQPAADREHSAAHKRHSAAALALDDVTAGWGPEGTPPVIRKLSLRVNPGEHVALVGPSGVGKSTVAALFQTHLMPVAGRVFVGGAATDEAPPASIRRRIATVEQHTFLFHGSIADNLMLADPNVTEHGMWRALAVAGLADEVRAMPRGLGTPVGEHGLSLSGGQSQRLGIARAVIRDAPILILDEPTSQVDLMGEAAFLAQLRTLARGRTVLMIAHRPGSMLAADRTISLTPQPTGHAQAAASSTKGEA